MKEQKGRAHEREEKAEAQTLPDSAEESNDLKKTCFVRLNLYMHITGIIDCSL